MQPCSNEVSPAICGCEPRCKFRQCKSSCAKLKTVFCLTFVRAVDHELYFQVLVRCTYTLAAELTLWSDLGDARKHQPCSEIAGRVYIKRDFSRRSGLKLVVTLVPVKFSFFMT